MSAGKINFQLHLHLISIISSFSWWPKTVVTDTTTSTNSWPRVFHGHKWYTYTYSHADTGQPERYKNYFPKILSNSRSCKHTGCLYIEISKHGCYCWHIVNYYFCCCTISIRCDTLCSSCFVLPLHTHQHTYNIHQNTWLNENIFGLHFAF